MGSGLPLAGQYGLDVRRAGEDVDELALACRSIDNSSKARTGCEFSVPWRFLAWAYISVFSHDFQRVERCAQLVLSSYLDEVPTMQAKMKRCLLGAAFGASLMVPSCQSVQTTRGGV